MNATQLMQEFTHEQRTTLKTHHFDAQTFLELRQRLKQGQLSVQANRLSGEVRLPEPADIQALPAPNTPEHEAALRVGTQAIEAGEVGMLVLNGGMATRFGGVVKGSVEVCEGLSFLGLKFKDAARAGARVPVILMNSFATHQATLEHLERHDYFGLAPDRVDAFTQNISVRLLPDGQLFRDAQGDPSFYAPGHGDLPEAIQRAALARFLARGGKYIWMSNVDNVLATLDPVILGGHILASRAQGVQMTVESAPRLPEDSGGMPARVQGHLQVVESFRFPSSFDHASIPVFNTNTFIFDADALEQPSPLTWFLVEKTVNQRKIVQLERLAGELSAFLKTRFVAIEREGSRSRFLPIKHPEDLMAAQDFLRAVMTERGVL